MLHRPPPPKACACQGHDAATMRPRAEPSTDDKVNKQAVVNCLVRPQIGAGQLSLKDAGTVQVLPWGRGFRCTRCTRYLGFLWAPASSR